MTLDEKWKVLAFYHPEWQKHITRHDSYDDQGARRIMRAGNKTHTPYGSNCWAGYAMAATGDMLLADTPPVAN